MTDFGASHIRRSSPFEHYEDQLNGNDFAQNSVYVCLLTGAFHNILNSIDTIRWHSYKKKFGIWPIFVRAAYTQLGFASSKTVVPKKVTHLGGISYKKKFGIKAGFRY